MLLAAVSRSCIEGSGSSGCPLANHLPWYFGLLLLLAWAVVALATVALLRRRIRGWLERRQSARDQRKALREGHGTDIELY
jgi:hypothetical protein